MEEQWMPVVGYEGWYEVSDLGRVRSLTRTEIKIRLGKKFTYLREGIELLGDIDVNGYLRVSLTVREDFKPKTRTHKVHCLVMAAFIGPRPEGWCIDHLNRNTTDARLCNLEYVTPRENVVRGIGCAQRPNKSCKFTGVRLDPDMNKFVVRKVFNAERFYLGTFEFAEDAYEAYELATQESANALKNTKHKFDRVKVNTLDFLRNFKEHHLTGF